jgi:hypothetical protein
MSNISKGNIPMKKFMFVLGVCAVILALGFSTSGTKAQAETPVPATAPAPNRAGSVPKLYLTAGISPTGPMASYETLGREVSGKVVVKLHTGESPVSNHVQA